MIILTHIQDINQIQHGSNTTFETRSCYCSVADETCGATRQFSTIWFQTLN